MKKIKVVGPRLILFGAAFFVLVGFGTVALWNALMPAIFGLPTIGYWQALGLLVLSRLLFGGWGGGGQGFRKPRFVNGWKDLTPEERERFSQAVGDRCRHTPGEGEAAGNA